MSDPITPLLDSFDTLSHMAINTRKYLDYVKSTIENMPEDRENRDDYAELLGLRCYDMIKSLDSTYEHVGQVLTQYLETIAQQRTWTTRMLVDNPTQTSSDEYIKSLQQHTEVTKETKSPRLKIVK